MRSRQTVGDIMQEKLRVLIIDDHPLMRRGIKQLVELDDCFEVVADVGNGAEGITVALQTQPDLIILDLNMKGLSGLDTLKGLRAEEVDARILILTVSDAKNDIYTLIDAGADGYLLKDTEPDVLLSQIKRIAQGEVILSDSIKNLLLERKQVQDPIDTLTEREMDVLRLIATGLSNKQIAGQLFISEETVKVHIRNLLRKLNVHSRVAATVLYFERNGR
ncbi:DNA-binding response regulator in two-component regulatory system with NarQ or NarX [Haemophilus pittmaniae]|nr:DNA-binding response regulator in two-component regulatory system with NarQ or NarX [Haemophilus pittmaniae]